MTPLEILAVTFAVVVLIKLLVLLIQPKSWIKISNSFLKEGSATTFVYLILVLLVGYHIFSYLSVIHVAAVMLFTSLLIGLSVLPYGKVMVPLTREILKDKNLVKKNFLSFIIYGGIALWVLYTMFG